MLGAKRAIVARAIDEIFETSLCELLRQRMFPEQLTPSSQEELDTLLVQTNSTYTDAVNECVRVFRNGLGDDSDEALALLESKLLAARAKLDANVGAIASELDRRKQGRKPK